MLMILVGYFIILVVFMKYSAIFRLKCNDNNYSIPKRQIKALETFL